MRVSKFIILPAMVLLTSSCALFNTAKQDSPQAVKQAVETPESWAIKAKQYDDDSINWLKTFNDPMMLKLIAEGKANNINLRVAAGNMDKAWLLAKQSGAALKPTADLSLGGTQSGSVDGGASNSNVTVGLQASWELDVWGRMKSGVDAATASAQAAEADYIFAQHSLSGNIAKTYFKVIEAKLQADITRKNLATLEKGMRITQVKYDNGLSSGLDVALNRTNLASAKEQLIQIEGSERDALRALEVLLGRYPSASADIPNILPDLPLQPPAGIPSELLERRPDIVSAERKIASAFNATDQAKAARLPRFSLTASVNSASSSLSDVLDPANAVWQLAANLMAPLMDGGRRKIDIEIATVEQKQAIANYAQAALTAFSEVEDNLDQGAVLARRETALSEAFRHSNKAYSIAELRYKEGEIELLDTLQIQQQAISAESQLLSIKRAQLEQRINFYLALGGSW
ncbi:MAG: efflux transporter outer membrane subunit [Gammaproteobacteria bacterium]|nr:efflux transporter outer membrane subunit [Gammaproteobacteria bacterium]